MGGGGGGGGGGNLDPAKPQPMKGLDECVVTSEDFVDPRAA